MAATVGEPFKAVTCYEDGYGNDSKGRAVVIVVQDKEPGVFGAVFTCLEPKSMATAYRGFRDYQVCKIPDDIADDYPVGYYSHKSHFDLLLKMGKTIGGSFDRMMEKSTREDDVRTTTWYSVGLKIRTDDGQTELY